MNTLVLTDKAIIRLIKENPNQGMRQLMTQYQDALYPYILTYVYTRQDAQDILQTTFIKAWKSIAKFKQQSTLKTWLYTIARNESLTHLKKNKRYSAQDVTTLLQQEQADGYFDGDSALVQLHAAIYTLPQRQQEVFSMRYFHDMSYGEIAEILHLSTGALKASYHHARKKVEDYIRNSSHTI